MPYYPDLSQYNNQKYLSPDLFKDVYNVGWLNSDHSFPTENSDSTLLSKIRNIILNHQGVGLTLERGIGACPLCNEVISIPRANLSERYLGISEIWIPFNGKVYVSPDMIFHHILIHSYKPPQTFEKAILNFDSESKWDSHKFFNSLEKQGRN